MEALQEKPARPVQPARTNRAAALADLSKNIPTVQDFVDLIQRQTQRVSLPIPQAARQALRLPASVTAPLRQYALSEGVRAADTEKAPPLKEDALRGTYELDSGAVREAIKVLSIAVGAERINRRLPVRSAKLDVKGLLTSVRTNKVLADVGFAGGVTALTGLFVVAPILQAETFAAPWTYIVSGCVAPLYASIALDCAETWRARAMLATPRIAAVTLLRNLLHVPTPLAEQINAALERADIHLSSVLTRQPTSRIPHLDSERLANALKGLRNELENVDVESGELGDLVSAVSTIVKEAHAPEVHEEVQKTLDERRKALE